MTKGVMMTATAHRMRKRKASWITWKRTDDISLTSKNDMDYGKERCVFGLHLDRAK